LQGQQAKSWFAIEYQGVTTPYTENIGSISSNVSQVSFDPKIRFDEATALGASTLTPVNFDVYYSVADNNNCTVTTGPFTLTVANQIEVVIAGLDDNDIFCSNETNGEKVLSFNPFPADASKRAFTINGQATPLGSEKFNWTPGLSGGDFELRYVVISGNNCSNTDVTNVKVLPSPQSVFAISPGCEDELLDFNANGTGNLPSAIYTWAFNDSIRSGQNLQHRFPKIGTLSSYGVQLKVAYPAFNNDPTLVCQDSMRLDQVIGPVPNLDFDLFNVCESETANFEVKPDIAISSVSWDFGDGSPPTGLGFLSSTIPATATTSGTYQLPSHKYSLAGDYDITITGRTSNNFGGCESTYTREVAILKDWSPTPTEPIYNMAEVDNGRGFWVKEDVNGNSTWDFNVLDGARIKSSEMAWTTGPTEPYLPLDVSYVNSPCFDLSSFVRPVLSLKHWADTEQSDGAVLQFSIDGGLSWARLGNVASGLEWYNEVTIQTNPGDQPDLASGWSVSDQLDWAIGKHTLDVIPGTRQQVRFRIAFASGVANLKQRDGFAFNNFVIEERNRTILVENFTTTSSTTNNNNYRGYKAIGGIFNTNELIKIQYHHFAGTNAVDDPLNQANPQDQNARAAFYGVTDPERAFIDGGFGQSATNFTFVGLPSDPNQVNPFLDNYFSLRSLVTSPVDISVDFAALPADKLNVKATIQANTTLDPGLYNVFIAIVEKEVSGHLFVLRKFLPDAAGTPLTSLSETDQPQEITAAYDMRHVTRLTSGQFAPIGVVVFVQNLETKDVLQTFMRQDATVDASEIVTGAEVSFENYIRLYPNPADQVLNVILPAPVKTQTPVKVFDSFGRQMFQSIYKAGEHTKTIETKTFSSGVYLIQIETESGLIRKKAMVVHE
jgi:hypothetical protein